MSKQFVSVICFSVLVFSLAACVAVPATPAATPQPTNSPHRTSIMRQLALSMEPNIHEGDLLLIEEVPVSELQRGDVIVVQVSAGEAPLLKRLIALPGETVALRAGKILINGQPLEESYHPTAANVDFRSVTLKEGEYFVLGDNRNNSSDSRAFGPVSSANIRGRVVP